LASWPDGVSPTGFTSNQAPRLVEYRPNAIAYEQRGEFPAAVELRQLFPGIMDNAQARECVRTIAICSPLPKRQRLCRPTHADGQNATGGHPPAALGSASNSSIASGSGASASSG
jgi:hypothetical protein